MDLASLWPAQSSLLLPLAMHLCSNGTLDMTSRDVNPGPPGRPLPLGKPNCPIVVCSYFWVSFLISLLCMSKFPVFAQTIGRGPIFLTSFCSSLIPSNSQYMTTVIPEGFWEEGQEWPCPLTAEPTFSPRYAPFHTLWMGSGPAWALGGAGCFLGLSQWGIWWFCIFSYLTGML